MTHRSPIDLRRKQRRLIISLIASILLPMGLLLMTVLIVDSRRERADRELTLYHLPTESLARQLRTEIDLLVGVIKKSHEGENATPFPVTGLDMQYNVGKEMDEIFRIQESYGSARYAPVIDRIRRGWDRFETEVISVGTVLDANNTDSLAVGLQQLERLHRAESSRQIAALKHHGELRNSSLFAGGVLVLIVSGLLTWRIARLMREMVGEIDERTADLTESERRFRQLADNIDAVFWITDVDTKTALFVSPGYEKIWGRSLDSLEADPESWIESILPEYREPFMENLATVAEGRTLADEYRIRRPDGEIRWVRDRAFPVRDASGKIVRMAGVAADVTEEKLAQEKVLLSEGHLRSLMESAQGFAVFRVAAEASQEHAGKVVFVSPSFQEMMGVPDPTDFDSWFKNIHEEDLPRVVIANRKMVEDFITFGDEFRIFHSSLNEWRWMRAICQPVHDASTGRNYFNGIVIDITEEKRARREVEVALGEIEKLKNLMEVENVYLREELRLGHLHEDIVGESEALRKVMLEVERVSETDSTVLILGETGTGKELVARAIQRMSGRSDQPMLAVNCAAIPATLVESELFGREKGAYTGALTSQMGRFEAANGGTIFLDEVGELPEAMQAKLLRVLEEGCFERLGSTKPVRVDLRVIAATNRDLEERVRAGEFREDLFYRLNVFPITIPPLRDRVEDIPLLARHFVMEFAAKMGKNVDSISKQTLAKIKDYSWPGNVRQLRNVIERGMIVTQGKKLRVEIPSDRVRKPAEKRSLAEVEKIHIIATLNAAKWRIRGTDGAAELLGLPPSTLESRMKKLGIERPGKAEAGPG